MEINNIKFEDNWSEKCEEKGNLDFSVIKVASRYWNNCTSKVYIFLGDTILFETEGYLKGDTIEDCKLKTEKWIEEKLEMIIKKVTQ